MTKSLREIVTELRELFPALPDEKIAELALGQTKKGNHSGVTVSELLKPIRKIYWEKELKRLRAKKKSDGSMNLKDTSTYRVYDNHWKRLESIFGERDIAELKANDVIKVALLAEEDSINHWNNINTSRQQKGLPLKEFTGANAYNACVDAISVVFKYAIDEELITLNRTHSISRKEIDPPKRHGLSSTQIVELLDTAASGGNDPMLDHLIMWTQVETGARMSGILKLQLGDIDTKRQTIMLVEKRSKKRIQPVTRELMENLMRLASTRGAKERTDSVFRYLPNKDGISNPLTSKRFETLWKRLGQTLPWVASQGISSHYLRHTVLTWVDRVAGHSVARAYAGHSAGDTTDFYTSAGFSEIVSAHSLITGTIHPTQVQE